MNKQIFFAHSGGPQGKSGQGSYDFVQWLREELEPEYMIHDPVIEDPDAPSYEMWETMLDRELCGINGDVILIGHSLGGSVLAKYLSEKTCRFQPAGLFLVAAPWWGAGGWDAEEFALDTGSRKQLPSIPMVRIYHCTDDPVVPFRHAKLYQKMFPDAFLHELSGSDHTFSDGLPLLVEHIKRLHINQQTKERY
jgi:predicted alpha/beta hydrolase family esterase